MVFEEGFAVGLAVEAGDVDVVGVSVRIGEEVGVGIGVGAGVGVEIATSFIVKVLVVSASALKVYDVVDRISLKLVVPVESAR